VQVVVGDDVSAQSNREVTTRAGEDFARTHEMMFIEASAKTKVGVQQAFEELVTKVRGRFEVAVLRKPTRCSWQISQRQDLWQHQSTGGLRIDGSANADGSGAAAGMCGACGF
jgi:hypothetical protein